MARVRLIFSVTVLLLLFLISRISSEDALNTEINCHRAGHSGRRTHITCEIITTTTNTIKLLREGVNVMECSIKEKVCRSVLGTRHYSAEFTSPTIITLTIHHFSTELDAVQWACTNGTGAAYCVKHYIKQEENVRAQEEDVRVQTSQPLPPTSTEAASESQVITNTPEITDKVQESLPPKSTEAAQERSTKPTEATSETPVITNTPEITDRAVQAPLPLPPKLAEAAQDPSTKATTEATSKTPVITNTPEITDRGKWMVFLECWNRGLPGNATKLSCMIYPMDARRNISLFRPDGKESVVCDTRSSQCHSYGMSGQYSATLVKHNTLAVTMYLFIPKRVAGEWICADGISAQDTCNKVDAATREVVSYSGGATTFIECLGAAYDHEPAKLTCVVMGLVSQGISWYRPNGGISQKVAFCDEDGSECQLQGYGNRYDVHYDSPMQLTLTIFSFDKDTDAGKWTCSDGVPQSDVISSTCYKPLIKSIPGSNTSPRLLSHTSFILQLIATFCTMIITKNQLCDIF
ncbi:uncharacterized protein LOC121377638 isoform X2 [Gigantopelta aegis]|nr:uncharacterized protein LOC121377638 isoform X2 [Gigantopelta aegis]